MPLLDLPIDQLRTYAGRNPRPADFDAYWDAALAELEAIDPQVELVPAAFQVPRVECFDLYFTGTLGARIHAKYLRPRGAKPRSCPAVVEFHGYSMSAGDWWGKLGLAGQGFCVATMDCRGQGGTSEDPGGVRGATLRGHIVRGLGDPRPEALLYRHIFLDAARLARVVMALDEVAPDRVAAWGGSQGGGLTLACAALTPRLNRCAALYPFLCDYRRVWEMDQAKDAYEELKRYFRDFDPRHEREDEIFTRLGYIDVQHLAPRIRARTLMATGLMDSICPPSTQFAAYNKITAPKEVVFYPDFGHESLPGFQDRLALYLCELLR